MDWHSGQPNLAKIFRDFAAARPASGEIRMIGVFCDGSSATLRRDLPWPEPGDGEVALRVLAAGICDTDLQLARGYMGFHGVLGHEFVGLGDDGRRYTAEINNACHSCVTCRRGHPGHCPNRTVLGILGHDGAMAERVCVPGRNLHAIPDSLDDAEAAFVEPLASAFRIAEQVALGPDTAMAVVGDGKLGLLCAWAARLSGARVSLIGKHPHKLALAGEGVATHLLDDAPKLAHAFDIVADCTGSPHGLATALQLVRPLGTVVLKTTIAGTHDLGLAPIVVDEIRLVGSRCGPFPRALAALEGREIDVRPLIGAEFPLDRAEDAFRAASRNGAMKMLLRM